MNILDKKVSSKFWNNNPCGGEWSTYADFLKFMQETDEYLYNTLKNYDWHNKYVLEIGCGQGPVLNFISKFDAKSVGIDMSFSSLKIAQSGSIELKNYDRVNLTLCDAENISFRNNIFDIIISDGVLHHTPNIEASISEIYRVLKDNGCAIIMLYRKGNPKWWLTKIIRGISSIVDKFTKEKFYIANHIRKNRKVGELKGTALLELFGVPILKAYTNKECKDMFSIFNNIKITNFCPGFERNCDIISILKPFRKILRLIDNYMENIWGFYQIIEIKKFV